MHTVPPLRGLRLVKTSHVNKQTGQDVEMWSVYKMCKDGERLGVSKKMLTVGIMNKSWIFLFNFTAFCKVMLLYSTLYSTIHQLAWSNSYK